MLKSLYIKTSLIYAGDEVGRGCFAGPLVVGLVACSKKFRVPKWLNDSKILTTKNRVKIVSMLKNKCKFGIGIVSPFEIDELGMTQATKIALSRASKALNLTCSVSLPTKIIFDGTVDYSFSNIEFEAVKKGDTKFIEIAIAANFAKVFRDELMSLYNNIYGKYNLAKNVGYGTKVHIESLRQFGPTRIHRKLFLRKFNEQEKTVGTRKL